MRTMTIAVEADEEDFGGVDITTTNEVNPATIRQAIAEALAKIPGVEVETVFT